jgi:hypothetical protein
MHLDDVPRELLVAIAAVASIYAVVLFVGRWLERLGLRRRTRRASEGEKEAALLLERHGFAVEATQAVTRYAIEVDGMPVDVTVRADYLVSRRGERFVAEVKTGRLAPRLETPATRRQLLEYQHAFAAAGVLLVDADEQSVRRVEFHRR